MTDHGPRWVTDAIFYQIFPDRFARSNRVDKLTRLEDWYAPPTFHGYKGGDLFGIEEKLDWLADLGINAIYFNPIFHSASNHRYHTYDFYNVDPMLGGNAAFSHLAAACKTRGIRFILDAVFNHTGRGFFPFHDVMEAGQNSPWVDWFYIKGFPVNAYSHHEPPNYEAWWGMHALPKLNTDNPRVREYLMRVGEFWIDQGADGFRLDVPNEIHTPGFWEEFRERVQKRNPDAYLVGELWGDASHWINHGNRFHGTMNYLFTGNTIAFVAGKRVDSQVVAGASYRVEPPIDAGTYGDAIEQLMQIYPESVQLQNLNLLGSHDTPRILTVASGDRTSVMLASVLLFTFPGAPCIYYGDEIGMQGGRDPGCRGGFPWEQPETWDNDLRHTFRTLAALRHEHEALRSGSYRRLWPSSGNRGPMLYVCARELLDETLIVAVNAGDETEEAVCHFHITGNLPTIVWGEGNIVEERDGLRFKLLPRSACIWKTRDRLAGAHV